MKITAIKQQVKRPDRYSVYVDQEYAFSLSENELLDLGLKLGQEYTKQELDELKQRAVVDKGYDRALRLIMRRPRSRWELQDYLRRKDYDASTQEEILDKLTQRGYVDDADFAKRWVESRRLLKKSSRRRLVQELRQKRVDNEIIEKVLSEDETSEKEVLKELVQRKRQQTRYQDKTKLMQYLSRQGFNYEDIKSALSEDS